jgi:serine protease AprX
MNGQRSSGGIRANALWGRGGRGSVVFALAALALGVTTAAAGTSSSGLRLTKPISSHARLSRHTYVSSTLLRLGRTHPNRKVRVIIQSSGGVNSAASAFTRVDHLDVANDGESVARRLGLVGGISATITAKKFAVLARMPGLTVTPDLRVRLDAYSAQLWPYADRLAPLWPSQSQYQYGTYQSGTSLPAPTIAVVDSGIAANRSDFGGRVVADVNLSSLSGNSSGDGRGHGTAVAGVAAGSAFGYAGASPTSKIVSIDVMDDQGMARTSDVIAAAQWILANKDQYNIRVANFSLHAANPSNFTRDPLDKAVEKLWFGGVVVVAAAGNYAVNGQPSGVKSAPGNDPFVITVGAADLNGTLTSADDTMAPWSSFGYTYDGFAKPELSAAGRGIVMPVPSSSTLALERPDHIVSPGYMRFSGTSFSAPIVAGAAAQILARHPRWTPDQVKGALMLTARNLPLVTNHASGVGELNAAKAARVDSPPNPNLALDRFLVPDPSGDPLPVFNAVSYDATTKSDVSWDAVSYDAAAWPNVSWDTVSWALVSYDAVSYTDVSYDAVSYEDVSYADGSNNDQAGAAVLSPTDQALALAGLDPAANTP